MTTTYFQNKPIEIIGKIRQNSSLFVGIRNNGRLWFVDALALTIKNDPNYVTEEILEQSISHLNPRILLKRLDNPDYLPKERTRFLNTIKMCYDLNPIEQRLWKMYDQTNSQ